MHKCIHLSILLSTNLSTYLSIHLPRPFPYADFHKWSYPNAWFIRVEVFSGQDIILIPCRNICWWLMKILGYPHVRKPSHLPTAFSPDFLQPSPARRIPRAPATRLLKRRSPQDTTRPSASSAAKASSEDWICFLGRLGEMGKWGDEPRMGTQ